MFVCSSSITRVNTCDTSAELRCVSRWLLSLQQPEEELRQGTVQKRSGDKERTVFLSLLSFLFEETHRGKERIGREAWCAIACRSSNPEVSLDTNNAQSLHERVMRATQPAYPGKMIAGTGRARTAVKNTAAAHSQVESFRRLATLM